MTGPQTPNLWPSCTDEIYQSQVSSTFAMNHVSSTLKSALFLPPVLLLPPVAIPSILQPLVFAIAILRFRHQHLAAPTLLPSAGIRNQTDHAQKCCALCSWLGNRLACRRMHLPSLPVLLWNIYI